MPSSNGVFSLPAGYLATTGQTILASQHNPPLEDIAAALTGRLSRDGTAAMTGGLKAIAGTAAIPGYAFSTDPSSGFYKTTAGVGVAIGGVQVAEFASAGLVSGVFFPGMLLPHTCTAAPSAVWVLPFGQTLSRTGNPQLWAQAQIEIAAGNTLYNNGDGSTTFGILDLRGRVPAGCDTIGGSFAGRLSGVAFATGSATVLGSTLGAVLQALTAAQIPAITSTGGLSVTSGPTNILTTPNGNATFQNGTGVQLNGPVFTSPSNTTGSITSNGTANVTSNNTGGAAHPNVQPTILTNYILFAGN